MTAIPISSDQPGAGSTGPGGSAAPPAPGTAATPVPGGTPIAPAGADAVRRALAQVVGGGTLSRAEGQQAMGAVMDGQATPAQLAGFLVALRMRGETVDELIGFARAMRERAIAVEAPEGALDTCGTGGDGQGTLNISTGAALVVAAAGVPVAKHGNRAITSSSGSADVLEALGVSVRQSPLEAARALADDGFAFLFAPDHHPAMRHAGPTRREIGVRTVFNLIGPLTNPAGVRRQVVGCAEPGAAPRLAAALQGLGALRAFVVHGDGLDELPLDGSGVIHDVTPDAIKRRRVRLEPLGLREAMVSELAGGTAEDNARAIESILGGERGPRRDVVLLNAGAALLVAGRVRSLASGVALAARTVDSGAGTALLARLRARAAFAADAAAATAEASR